jgi:hypothetical protein
MLDKVESPARCREPMRAIARLLLAENLSKRKWVIGQDAIDSVLGNGFPILRLLTGNRWSSDEHMLTVVVNQGNVSFAGHIANIDPIGVFVG